jgi:dTDP-4-dehydrorhamnose reductase
MKALVTGADGLVGSRFVELEERLELVTPTEQELDVTKPNQIREFLEREKPDWVIHFAAYTNVEKAQEEQKELAYKVNYIGTKNLIGICNELKIKLMYLSTDHVFPGEGMYIEDDKQKPVNYYGETKFLGEQAIMAAGSNWLLIRTSYPYRAEFANKKDVVRTILEKLQNKESVELVVDQAVTPTFIDDLVIGISKLVRDNQVGIYHISGRDCLSFYDMGKILCEVFDLDYNLIKGTTLQEFMTKYNKKAPQPKKSCMNSNKFQKNTMMIMPDFREGVIKMKTQLSPVKEINVTNVGGASAD